MLMARAATTKTVSVRLILAFKNRADFISLYIDYHLVERAFLLALLDRLSSISDLILVEITNH